MRTALAVCVLIAVFGSTVRAQDQNGDYAGHFGWGAEPVVPEPTTAVGPRSIDEAKEQGRGYRIGTRRDVGRKVHVVEPGDTLWDISSYYFGDPWHWPELWSFNPEVTNPHWIYPLDQLRLSPEPTEQPQLVAATEESTVPEGGVGQGYGAGTGPGGSVVVPPALVQEGTIFLRDQGYLDPEALRTVGQIIGGNEEHMLLSPSDQVYIRFREDHDVQRGQSYSVYRPIHEWEREENEEGELVRIAGTVEIQSYDRDKRVARALITEALDSIERGIFVAKVDRRFHLVPPKRNQANVVARVIATVQPRRLIAYDHVVFLDVGEGSGVAAGNRFFVVHRGDAFLEGIDVDPMEVGNIVEVPEYDKELLPKEVIAELRVLKVRKNTTIALVTRSDIEVTIGDRAEMRIGF